MKLLAIDGNSIVNRAFYGIKLLTTKEGVYTNGIYGFINILNRLIEKENPDAVAVAFDVHTPTFRHKEYAAYKAGRKGMPEELRAQMPVLKEWLSLAGYKYVEAPTYEADDILGTFAATAEQNEDECVIATGDRDALQLVSDETRVLLTATKMGRPELTDFTREKVFEKYGLYPESLIDLKGLMGDSSDNIPGVPGIGEGTATELLKEFGSIDGIYESIEKVTEKRNVRAKLIEGKESAYLSKRLGTIYREVPIDTDFSHYVKAPYTMPELATLMTRLEFFKLMENMNISAGAPLAAKSAEKEKVYKFVPFKDFSASDTADFAKIEKDYYVCSAPFISKTENIKDLKAILENDKIKKRIYDYKNLYKELSFFGIEPANVVFDSMLAGYLASPSASSYALPRLAAEYEATEIKLENSEEDENLLLAAKHTEVCDKLTDYLAKNEQLKLLTDIEIPLARVLAEMETTGFLIDTAGVEDYGKELGERIKTLENEIYSLVGYEFNLNSPKQLGVALFEKLGLPAKKKTKSGYSTNAEVLEELKSEHPAVEKLLEYRRLAKLKSTYCDGLLVAVSEDGKVRSTFNQTETRTGRISSLEPNLQNIPVRTEEGKKLRKFFKAAEGYVLCDADYSQIELRVLAHIANEQNMIDAFLSGADFHTTAAARAFGLPADMVTPVLRSRAKAINFGIIYGIGAFSLAKDIGVTTREAKQYIASYLEAYPNISVYMNAVIENAKADGFVTTAFGRRRYLPELASSNGMMRAFGERVARNAPIQGTAADIIKIAMIRVSDRLKNEKLDARLILQVHDELIVECREQDAKKVCDILAEEMEKSAELKVPLNVDAHFGKNWLEAKQ
ncbi:MAG: DNA polymerase I [Clostridiales bacterium]|nr:DNA polymerase I [Candidatus Equinaster intestinalis]